MPQELQVLLCVACKTFQVHIVKKSSNKWNCKICSTKQSVLQIYAKGSGVECREVVKQLNFARGTVESQENQKILGGISQDEFPPDDHRADETDYNLEETPEAFHVDSQELTTQDLTASQALLKQKSGVLSVPEEQSKWRIFLDLDED